MIKNDRVLFSRPLTIKLLKKNKNNSNYSAENNNSSKFDGRVATPSVPAL